MITRDKLVCAALEITEGCRCQTQDDFDGGMIRIIPEVELRQVVPSLYAHEGGCLRAMRKAALLAAVEVGLGLVN